MSDENKTTTMKVTITDDQGNLYDQQTIEVHQSWFSLEVVPKLPGIGDPRAVCQLDMGDHYDA